MLIKYLYRLIIQKKKVIKIYIKNVDFCDIFVKKM